MIKKSGCDTSLNKVILPQLSKYFCKVMSEGLKGNEFGSDESMGTVTLPQMNLVICRVISEKIEGNKELNNNKKNYE